MRRTLLLGSLLALAVVPLAACDPFDQTIHVNASGFADGADAYPGDGVCETTTPDECTLRAAVMEANANAAAHPSATTTIELPDAQGFAIFPAHAEDDALVGDLDIKGAVVIHGHNSSIFGADQGRLFEVHSGRLQIDHVTLRDGSTLTEGGGGGGAILNHASLIVSDSILSTNATASGGLAIHQTTGSTVLYRTKFLNN